MMTSDTEDASVVLIVDDERGFANMLAKRLALRGFTCTVAYDGSSALDLLAETAFSSVVLDLRLPDLTGTEVLVRARARLPSLPVVILTGHGSDEDEKECRRLGAVAFLHKPVELAQLVSVLSETTRGSR